tara:strand:- start:58 stop:573 length:516 start_codon:yes stop_codon:yes gene_type:complete
VSDDDEEAREAVKETVQELVREFTQKNAPYLVLLFILYVPFFHAVFTEGSPPLDFQRSLWHPIVILSTVLGFLNACFLGVRYFKFFKALNREKYKLPEYSKPSNKMEIKVDGTATTLLYILSFFIPFAGFIVGAIYLSKEEEHYKHVGKNCLIFSVMNIVIGFIMVALLFA